MSFSLSAGLITQSGTDANLSGLASVAGVVATDDDPTGRGIIIYDMGNLRLRITGTLSHDPDKEIMIFHHTKSNGSNSTIERVLSIAGGGTYNYGIRTSYGGKVGYSSGCGLIFSGRPFTNWHPSDSAIHIDNATANFVCRGGIIQSNKGFYLSGNVDIEETVFLNMTNRFSMEVRTFGRNDIVTDRAQNIILAGGVSIMDARRMSEQSMIFRKGAVSRVFGDYFETELKDFDVSKNTFDYDIGNCANDTQMIADHHIVNSKTGSDVRTMWRNTTGNDSQQGNTFIHKEVLLNIKDRAGVAIQGVKMYLSDNPSSFAKSVSYTTSHSSYVYPTPTLSTATISNAGKTISYDYTSAIVYEKTSDAAGNIAKFKVLTATHFLDKNANDSSATQYFTTFTGGKWRESDAAAPAYSDWDTTRFGGFYKVDRRSDSNTNTDDFTFNFCSYDHALSSTTQELKGVGELLINSILLGDPAITENKATADAYAVIENSEKFYNRAKAYLYDNFSGETSTIVSRDGDTIDAGSYNVTIDNSAGQAFGLSGNTITIKSSSFTGNITTSGNVTLTGTINYVGTITDASGTRSFGSYQIKNLVNGSRVQVYNTTTGKEIYNAVVSATSLTEGFTNTGLKAMNANDNIRVRVAYQNGATAKEPQELLATCQYPTWEVSANQVDATQYNNYSVDGSTITEFSLDIGTGKIEVDIDDTDNSTTVQRVASWYYAELMEVAGISDLFGAIDWIEDNQIAIDQSKVDLLLDNIKGVPLILKGGRLYRLDGTTIIASTSNSIQIDYAPVYIANAPLIEKIDKNTKLIPALL